MRMFFLSLFVVYLPFQLRIPQIPIINTMNFFLIILLIMMWGSKNKPVAVAYRLPLILFLLVWIGSFIHTIVDPRWVWGMDAAVEFKRLITLVLAYFIFANVLKDKKEVHFIFWVFLITLAVVGLHTARSGNLSGVNFADFKRAYGPFGTNFMASDIAGGFLATFTPLIFAYMVFAQKKLHQLAALLGLVVCVTGLFATYSRGSFVALAVSLFVMALFVFKNINKASRLSVFVLVLLGIVATINWETLIPATIVNRVEKTVVDSPYEGQDKLDKSSQRRIEIWQMGLDLIRSNPVFGIGFWQTRNAMGVDSHNAFLLIAIEMGLLGLVAFIWFLLAVFREAASLIHTEFIAIGLGCIGLVVAIAIVNMFYSNIFRDTVAGSFWVMLGILTSAKRVAVAEQSEN